MEIMLTEAELSRLLGDIESDRVERTVSTNHTDKFAQAVCAFANDFAHHRQPGYLLVGVKDDGVPSGLAVTDQLLQNLAALRSDGNIQPLPAMTVSRFSLARGDVAVVEVLPSDLPPVRYKGQVWIRVGPRKAIANEQEERILTERRIAYARSFDASPCGEASLHDLALGMFDAYRREALAPEVVEANHRSLEEQLASLRFYDVRRGCPTFAGIVLFGKNPRFFLPGAYVQYLRLPAASLTDVPLDQAEISGDLLSVLRELDARVKAGIHTTLRPVSALRERMVPDYPEWAVRELVMNAIIHRNYDSNTPIRFYWFSDRIEILSPGGLYGEVTPENFPTRNSYRNPIIAEAMKALGYVNRYGYGIARAQRLLRDNGNPPATFEFDNHTVAVRICRGVS
jgi:ATP-dependent DNA helicase RecG